MLRRAFLLAAPAVLLADARQEIYELFGALANSLAEGDALRFLRAFDPNMPSHQELTANINALVQQSEIHSTIEIIDAEGDARAQAVQLDWLLQLTEKQSSSNAIRRQQTVKCRLTKPKREWRVISIEPIAFFAPPKVLRK
jgi:hypothetical protein